MALTLKMVQVTGLRSRGDKLARITFRGVSQYTKTIENAVEDLVFEEVFTWPVGRPIESHESVDIHLLTYSKYLNNRILGRYGLVLQHVVEDGQLKVTDSMLDNNNMPMTAQVTLELTYHAPDGSIGSWHVTDTDFTCDHDDQKALLDIEQNIANLERRLSEKENSSAAKQAGRDAMNARGSIISGRSLERKRSISTRKTIASVMKLGKQRPHTEPEEVQSLKEAEQHMEYGSMGCLERRPSDVTMAPRPSIEESLGQSGDEETSGSVSSASGRRSKWQPSDVPSELKAQDFQVCVTIIEARQLAGLNMDPVVCIQVGDQKKYTSIKESTNCPYYNEYFVFDFQMTPTVLFDKIITISVLHSRNIIRTGKVLGTFKLDVGTVWSQPDRQFYHKWALLSDPEDPTGVPKGYVKCDISVIGKGDTVKIPQKSEKDEDDIEENLLIPDGFPMERQRARFIVRVYRADGLPRMNAGIVANVKKAFTGEAQDLVDPYVQISFAGYTGKTSVKKNCYTPVWNEQIVFTEMFPPLCQRIKVQLRDNDSVNDTVIGTHFIELSRISNEGEKGFLPTFGPAFIHLYGSTRDFSIFDEHTNLNNGLGEGVSYRGRLLIAIKTEILDSLEGVSMQEVDVEPTMPIIESTYGRHEEFFLFGTIMEADMIDRRIGDKQIYFEISIGNAGNALDRIGENRATRESDDEGRDDVGLENVSTDGPKWQSTTVPMRPISQDRVFFSVPYGDCKPCVYIYSTWQDHRRRFHNSNVISKVADRLDENLAEIQYMIQQENSAAIKHLKTTLEDLATGCSRYLAVVKGGGSSSSGVKTKLDKERQRLCQREMDHFGNLARSMIPLINKNTFKDKLKATQKILQKIRFQLEDPQHFLPDVFIWMISGGKRVAYHRMSARHLLFSIVEEECGRDCGILKTIFLKLPGKKGMGQPGWVVQAKLRAYFWLGLAKHKKNCLKGLPRGYEQTADVRNIDKPLLPPPTTIRFKEHYEFQLRAHMYEARSLIASDASGLSDPFARVVIGDQSATTQMIDQTLSPTWDEMLVFHDIVVYGTKDHMKDNPPPVIIEIYDQDKVGKAEFMGRVVVKPHVKTDEDPYTKPLFPPSLEWFELYRGCDPAGELLAAFELLQTTGNTEEFPPFPEPKGATFLADTGPCLPVPHGIRPVLSHHRIEVLFWGLRDLRRIHLMSVNRPRVDIECAGRILQSSVIQNYRKNPNFCTPVKYFDVDLPEEAIYCPSLTIRVLDCRSFGRYTLVGTHIINSLHKFLYTPLTKRERESVERKRSLMQLAGMDQNEMATALGPNAPFYLTNGNTIPVDTVLPIEAVTTNMKAQKMDANKKKKNEMAHIDDDEENKDWWTKYFASVELMIEERREAREALLNEGTAKQNGCLPNAEGGEKELKRNDHFTVVTPEKKRTFKGAATAARFAARLSPKSQRRKPVKKTALMKIYPNELESQPEFNGFREWLHTFELYRGKKTGDDTDDESRIVGKFKGSLKVYKIPLPMDIEDQTIVGGDPQYGLFHGLPNNDPSHVLVRVYVVKANDLHPMDINGKADPYLIISLGNKKINDKDNYISKQLNPVFGKCFEFEATFPHESMLTVQIYDWDLVGSDDLIGETKIDLENRLYSRHRATCGLAQRYEVGGYNQWRDPMKPTQVLGKLCKDNHLGGPNYMCNGLRIGSKTFMVQNRADGECIRVAEEPLALAVLQRWHELPKLGCKLVPEHVETRPLYNPSKPGIEQGKIEMWVDMFPMDMPLPGPPLDISPRKPTSYELRIIIWNTDEVVLEDDAFFSGEKMSDIYVKGWLKGQEDTQTTDIHYRSLTGEGNFNWRFIFPFDYLVAEEKIVISRKESLFSWDETESKIPARLVMQVWDADHFSADDFLGSITLDLNRFPRGAKSSKLCTLEMLKTDGSVPMVSLFKQRRVKGWWPFYVKKDNDEMELTGKVEAELHLLPKEEAEKCPAGHGRNEPDPLDKPNRPDSSFVWFLNPLKSIRYIVWTNYKWVIVKAIVLMLLLGIFIMFFYAIPGYTVKKIIGA